MGNAYNLYAFFANGADTGICVISVYINLIDLLNSGNCEQGGYIQLSVVYQHYFFLAAL